MTEKSVLKNVSFIGLIARKVRLYLIFAILHDNRSHASTGILSYLPDLVSVEIIVRQEDKKFR